MPDFLDRLLDSWRGPLSLDPWDLLIALTCAFGCSLIVSEAYRRSHRGVDFSRPFVQVLILITVVVAFVTLVVGDDLARAFTLVGALSVVRFRTAVKQARDLAFIFYAVGVGMGAGCRFLSLTFGFTLFVAALIWFLARTGYGTRDAATKVLRFRFDSSAQIEGALEPCFREHLLDRRRLSLSLVRQGTLYEAVYLVRLKPRKTERVLLDAIRAVTGDQPVSLTGRDAEAEF